MTIIQLECFLETAKAGSISKAAVNLYLSQPTLTRHIQALEEELNVQLFVRANNSIRLSPMGQALFQRLEDTYKHFQKESDEIREFATRQAEVLRIGIQAGQEPGEELLQALEQFRKEFPKVVVRMCHLSVKDSVPALFGGEVDLLYALSPSVPESDHLVKKTLQTDRMCLAVPASHPNAAVPFVRSDEIAVLFKDLEYHLMDVKDFSREIQSELMSRVDYESPELCKLNGRYAELDSVMLMIAAGLAMSDINEKNILTKNPRIRLLPIVDEKETDVQNRQVQLCLYGRKQNMSPTAQKFWKRVVDLHFRKICV